MGNITRLTLFAAVVSITVIDATTFAQGKPESGGTITTNNVSTAFDPQANTLFILGNSSNNMFSVTLLGTGAVVSPGIWGQTTIDGQSGNRSYLTDSQRPLNVVVDSAAGQDRVWVIASVQQLLANVSINAGDGNDDIAIYPSSFNQGCQLVGNVEVNSGKGDDSINLGAFEIFGNAAVDAGDGNDTASVHIDAILWNIATFKGGKGRDSFTASWEVLATAIVIGFETVVGQ